MSQKPTPITKVTTTSDDVYAREVEKLSQVCPQFVRENGTVDVDALREFFGESGVLAEGNHERYGLSWKGKSDAFRAIRVPATGTLAPQQSESKDWDTTGNVFVEGDNLEVLKLLQRHYRNRIKMIYIDPPYNTGKDFIYKDNFTADKSDYYEQTGQYEGGVALTSNPASSGRYHSDWLTMMYPRLFLARQLLRDDGVLFVSIDDNEVANLRLIMDEIFGEENFVAQIVWAAGRKNDSKHISVSHEYILVYVKDKNYLTENKILWRERKKGLDEIHNKFSILKEKYRDDFSKIEEELSSWFSSLKLDNPAKNHSHYSKVDERGVYFASDISWPGGGGPRYEVLHPVTKKPSSVPSRGWMFSDVKRMQEMIDDNRVHFGSDESSVPCLKSYLADRESQVPYSVFYQDGRASTKRLRELMGGDYFEHPKDETIISALIEYISQDDKDGIILDFFAGSGTTAHAVMAQNAEDGGNRQWICVQIPETTAEDSEAYKAGYRTIADISRERIRRAGAKIATGDVGFKSFKLTPSNHRQWQMLGPDSTDEEFMTQTNSLIAQPLTDDATEENVVYEIALKEGFSPHATIESVLVGEVPVWRVADGDALTIVTFVPTITLEMAETFGLTNDPLHTLVCLDSALTDTTKVNLSRLYNLKVI